MKEIIRLADVTYSHDSKQILSHLSVNIQEGIITGVIGPSGSGKTTFLRLLNRLISPSSGEIHIFGQNMKTFQSRDIRRQIGLVQQRPFLFPGTVRMNLNYGPKIWGKILNEKRLIELLTLVDLPSNFLERDIENLSGGEQQRVNLARTIANKPRILLADEPTGALDIASAEVIEKTLVSLTSQGVSIIIVTHSIEQTQRLTSQVLILKEGQIVEKITTKDFFGKYRLEDIHQLFKGKENG